MTTPRDDALNRGLPAESTSDSARAAAPDSVYVEEQPDGLKVFLVGEIDISNHAQLEEIAAKVAAREPSAITVDLSGASFVDSATLGFFAKMHNHAEAGGHQLTLFAPQRTVMRALTVVGFDRVMRIVQPDGGGA
jgi:anti-anti-sigma factor